MQVAKEQHHKPGLFYCDRFVIKICGRVGEGCRCGLLKVSSQMSRCCWVKVMRFPKRLERVSALLPQSSLIFSPSLPQTPALPDPGPANDATRQKQIPFRKTRKACLTRADECEESLTINPTQNQFCPNCAASKKQTPISLFMKLTLIILAALSWAFSSFAQTPPCREFNPVAQVGVVANSSLVEVSGVVVSRQNPNILWVHNDSGDTARVFALNPAGTHAGIFYLDAAVNVDWEDFAIGPGPIQGQDYLYLSDTGDNNLIYTSITIYRVPEPALTGLTLPITATLTGVETLRMQYPAGARYDAETLLVDPVTGNIYVVTRDRALTGTTYVFRYPWPQRPDVLFTLELVATINSSIEIKGGDVSAAGDWVILRPHSKTQPVNGMLWYRPAGSALESVFATTPCPAPLVFEPQGEAIGFTPDGTGYYTISEGAAQPIYFYGLLTPPAAPDKGTASALSDTQIRLSWSDNANNETGYFVDRSTDGVNYGPPVVLAANATGFTDSGLTASTLYWYRVTAHNNAGYSASLILTATTTARPPAPPSAPSGLTATAVSKTQINLLWTDTPNEDGYRIERSTDGTKFTQIDSVGANITSFANSGLTGNKLYYYRVRAYNVGGSSAYSIIASARTPKR